MRSWQRLCRAAMLSLALAMIVAGCSGQKEEVAKSEKPAAAPEAAPPVVSEELRQAMCEAVSMAPADAAVVVTFRSARTVVSGLNATCGPELASMAAVPLGLLPDGVFDMDGPIIFSLLMQDRPTAVFVMCTQEPRLIKGEDAGDGIIKMQAGDRDFYVMRMGTYAAFGDLEALKAYKKAHEQPLAVDKPTSERVAESLIWVYVNAKPLAALAKPALQELKTRLAEKQPGKPPASEVKAVEWAENLLGQLKTAEIGYNVEDGRVSLRARLTLTDDAALLAIAKAMKPIERYNGALPETDKFLMAGWANIDYAQATPQVKAFLRPLMDLVMEKLGEAATSPGGAPAGDAANPMAALRKAIDEQWALLDENGAAVGDRAAFLMETPERGKPFYRLTESVDLKDTAKYQALVKKGAASTERLLNAIMGVLPDDKAAPKMDMSFAYTPKAERIEETPVDVMQFKFAMQPPAGAPPQIGRVSKSINETLYGPEGLVMRLAVCDKRALAVVGDPEMMARAIKLQRGKVADLTKLPPIAAALKRVPKGASMAMLVSCPSVAYAGDMLIEEAMQAALPPKHRDAVKRIPAPKIERPALTEPAVAAMVVEGQAIRLEMDMPVEEGTLTVPYVRHAYGRILFNMIQLLPGFAVPEEPQVSEAAPPVAAPPPAKAPESAPPAPRPATRS